MPVSRYIGNEVNFPTASLMDHEEECGKLYKLEYRCLGRGSLSVGRESGIAGE